MQVFILSDQDTETETQPVATIVCPPTITPSKKKVRNHKHACDICGKKYCTPKDLAEHKNTHTGEKPYVCDICGKSFTSRSSHWLHQRKHTSEKDHKCAICGKEFFSACFLRTHERVHTGEKPYVCEICGKNW